MEHLDYMRLALEQAREAGRRGNRPVASLIVREGGIIGEGQNTMFTDFDPSAHAEITAIRDACQRLKTVDLLGATLYTTLEPCPMCFWAMHEAGIVRLVLGGRYAGIGRAHGRHSIESAQEFTGYRLEVITGVLAGECEALWLEWMKAARK